MRYLACVPVLYLSFCSMAPAVEMVDGKVKLEDDEKASLSKCKAEGGCSILTQKEMLEIVKYYMQVAYDTGAKSCGRKTI